MIPDPPLLLLTALSEVLQVLLNLPRCLAKFTVGCVRWVHQRAYQPIVEYWVETWVGLWEESIKSLVRECFQTWVRAVNGTCGWLVARIETFRSCKKEGGEAAAAWDFAAWETWRPSTFNWVVQNHRAKSDRACEAVGDHCPRETQSAIDSQPDGTNSRDAGAAGETSRMQTSWNIVKTHWKHSPTGNHQQLPSIVGLLKSFTGPPGAARRGWVEDLHITLEIAITRFFASTEWLIKKLFLLRLTHFRGRKKARKTPCARIIEGSKNKRDVIYQDRLSSLRPANSTGAINFKSDDNLSAAQQKINTAKQMVSDDGYVLEDYDVVTDDGYILTLHRLPRPQSRDAVFFQHGILDTSISWCANGVTGSLAYRAYEAGYDVWLGNCRASPPRRHQDPDLPSQCYWNYSLNELGQKDVGAQLEHIHRTKCRELESPRESVVRWKLEDQAGISPAEHATRIWRKAKISGARFSIASSKSVGNLENDGLGLSGNFTEVEEGPSQSDSFISQQSTSETDTCTNNRTCGRQQRHREQTKRNSTMNDPEDLLMPKATICLSTEQLRDRFCSQKSEDENECKPTPRASACSSLEPKLPYRLQGIGHSLGGAALLIYLVMSRRKYVAHRLHKLVLLSPAGFHHKFPPVAIPFIYLLPAVEFIWRTILRLKGFGIMIPGRFSRIAVYKGLQDILRFPGLRSALNLIVHLLLGGDKSPWDSAMQLPHYQDDGMPGISLNSALHLVQLVKSKKFQMYDYRDSEVHEQEYGQPNPVDIAAEYCRINIPVDIVAGRLDGVIPPVCVKEHAECMREAGVPVSYKEFDYGHLEFSFTVQDDLVSYMLDCLGR